MFTSYSIKWRFAHSDAQCDDKQTYLIELGLGEDYALYSETKKDAHPTRLQTSDDAQAVQRDAHLLGTK